MFALIYPKQKNTSIDLVKNFLFVLYAVLFWIFGQNNVYSASDELAVLVRYYKPIPNRIENDFIRFRYEQLLFRRIVKHKEIQNGELPLYAKVNTIHVAHLTSDKGTTEVVDKDAFQKLLFQLEHFNNLDMITFERWNERELLQIMQHIDKSKISAMEFFDCNITDNTVQDMKNFTSLKQLTFCDCDGMTDDFLLNLSQNTAINRLYFTFTALALKSVIIDRILYVYNPKDNDFLELPSRQYSWPGQ